MPLIISVPGGPQGNVVQENVSLMDLLPTMLDLAGDHELADLREPIDGQSLVPLINGGSRESVAYSEIMSDGLPAPIFMIRRDNWKLIYGPAYPAELYNLDEDPHEQRNLAAAPEAVDILNRLVAEAEAKAAGATSLFCHARDVKVGFYERLGMRVMGEAFAKYHGASDMFVEMEKTL